MKEITARLKVNTDGTWDVTTRSNGGSRVHKKTAVGAYRVIENKLWKHLKASLGGLKVSILVEYEQGYYNDTNPSENIAQTLYAITCFMEDYLPKDFLDTRIKKYLNLKEN